MGRHLPASRARGEAGGHDLLNDLEHFPEASGEAAPLFDT